MDPHVLLLVANQFDEFEVVRYAVEFRQAGIPVDVVGLASGLVRGQSGLVLMPDQSLAAMDEGSRQAIQILILAGGKSCAALLLSDPRTKALISQTILQNGTVVLLRGVSQFLHDAGLVKPHKAGAFLIQEDFQEGAFFDAILEKCC